MNARHGPDASLGDAQVQNHLALRKLEALAGAFLPVLLALVLPRVAAEHSLLLQLRAQFGIKLQQGARNAQLRGAGLAIRTAASRGDENVELVRRLGRQ